MCSTHYQRLVKTGTTDPPKYKRTAWNNGNGYLRLALAAHILASPSGKVYAHRVALFDKIGYGPHLCYWCNSPIGWRQPRPFVLHVDHLDHDRAHNDPSNLVASCVRCNNIRAAQVRAKKSAA